MSYDEQKNINVDTELISTDILDGPLLIVLDEDDYDEFENFDSTITTSSNNIISNHTEEQTIVSNTISAKGEQSNVEVKNRIKSVSIKSNTKSKFRRSSKSSTNKSIRTIVIDTSFVQQTTRQQHRTKSISKRKNISADSVLSYISFDKVSDILTVSRMGSIYYCVEDLYMKIFSSLCTLDEFTNLLIKPQILILKQTTLSEKISISQQNPKLKKCNYARYHLISIDSSDYLIKLKQSLITNENKQIENIINEMRVYKQTHTSIPLSDKVSTKRVSNDDVKQPKHLKTVKEQNKLTETTQFGIFIQCNGPVNCNIYSTNETISSNNSSTECLVNKSEIRSSSSIENININNSLSKTIPLRRLHRSKSLIYNKEEIKKRSYSLPTIKFDIKDNIMLKIQSKKIESIDLTDDNYPMPMIVNVEENVQINNQNIINSEQSLSNSQKPLSSSAPIPYPYLYRAPSYYLKPIRTPYNLYYQESFSSSPLYQKSKELLSNHQSKRISSPDSSSNISSPIIMSILERPIHHHLLTSEQEISTIPYYEPCYSHQLITDQSSISKDILPNERMIYRHYKSNFSNSKPPSLIDRKQHRISLSPYPPTKTYFAPLPILNSQNSSMDKKNVHRPKSPVYVQNSSTITNPSNGLRLPHICTQSIDLSQAIIEHNYCNMDKIPTLVVRHTKTYLTKTIDTMGQLFPSWFNEPDYRCIHCFGCDQVFTPQLFMTHVDDEQMVNEKPLHMTSIQLLTSEKMSQHKVKLWNEFCTNLTIYATEFAETEKRKNSSNVFNYCRWEGRILSYQKLL